MILPKITLYLLLASATSLVLCTSTSDDVGLICANKRVELTSLEQVSQLVDRLDQKCPKPIRVALHDFEQLTSHENESQDVCSQEKANQIQDHIGASLAAKDVVYPKSLKKLLVSYGMTISRMCRERMINELTQASNKVLTRNDLEYMDHLTGDQSLLANFLKEPSDYENLILPRHLKRLMKSVNSTSNGDNKELFLETKAGQAIRRIQAFCRRRAKPIYSKLILPLVTLANAGFNYRGEKQDKRYDVNTLVYQWYRIVFLCESLEDITIIERTSEQSQSEKMIRFYTEDEAQRLKREEPKAFDNIFMNYYKQVEFKPQLEPLVLSRHDQIYDINDHELTKAVKHYKLPRVSGHSTGFTRMVSFVKEKLSSGVVKIIGSMTGEEKNSKRSAGVEIIHRINGIMSRPKRREPEVSLVEDDYLYFDEDDNKANKSVAKIMAVMLSIIVALALAFG